MDYEVAKKIVSTYCECVFYGDSSIDQISIFKDTLIADVTVYGNGQSSEVSIKIDIQVDKD